MNTNAALIKLFASIAVMLIPISIYATPGDLYATDNRSIRVYAPYGSERIFASGLLRARGLAFDRSGNLFVATLDTASLFDGRGQILKFAPDGTATVFAAELDFPEGLAFDGAGNLYVALSDLLLSGQAFSPGHFPYVPHLPGRVIEFAPSGARREIIFDPTTFHQNIGVAVDAQDHLFVADNLQLAIYLISPNAAIGTASTINIFASLPNSPIGLAFGGAGNLYVSDTDPFNTLGNITKIAPDGTQTPFVSGLGALRGLAFDSNGNLFAAGNSNNVIYKITPDGSVSIFATGLVTPQFLAVEP